MLCLVCASESHREKQKQKQKHLTSLYSNHPKLSQYTFLTAQMKMKMKMILMSFGVKGQQWDHKTKDESTEQNRAC